MVDGNFDFNQWVAGFDIRKPARVISRTHFEPCREHTMRRDDLESYCKFIASSNSGEWLVKEGSAALDRIPDKVARHSSKLQDNKEARRCRRS